MHWEARIEWTQRCTERPWSSELGGRNRASLEIHLEAAIERVWRCTWKLWSCEIGGHNRASLDIQFEAVIEWDWTSTWRWSMDGTPGAETLFISSLTRNRGNVTRWLYISALIESYGADPEMVSLLRLWFVILWHSRVRSLHPLSVLGLVFALKWHVGIVFELNWIDCICFHSLGGSNSVALSSWSLSSMSVACLMSQLISVLSRFLL